MLSALSRGPLTAAVLAFGMAFAGPAAGLVILDSKTLADYQANAGTSPYSATGGVFRNGSFTSSGVLVSPTLVVAASHDPVNTTNGTFVIGGMTYNIATAQRFDADGDVYDGRDVAVYTLTAPVVGIAPAPLYTGTLAASLGTTAFYTGLGDRGTGSSPPGSSGAPDNLLLVGTNVIDQAGGTFTINGSPRTLPDNVLLADFDDGSAGNNQLGTRFTTNLEVGLAIGDSGGGLFLFNTATSRYELAGTHSAVIGNGFGYGQILVSTAFSAADRATIQALVPEPTTATVVLLLCAAGVGRRSRRQRM